MLTSYLLLVILVVFCGETWQTAKDSYELQGYSCIDVPRPSSLNASKRKRGHGGICLFIRNEIRNAIKIIEKNVDGFIWIKADKIFCNLDSNISCVLHTFLQKTQNITN